MNKTLIKANIKSHFGSLVSVFILVLLTSISFSVVTSVWSNSNNYIKSQVENMGFGDLSIWVSETEDLDKLIKDITDLQPVSKVNTRDVIFSNYEINHHESDSDGQLILYSPSEYSYKFFNNSLKGYTDNPRNINDGEVYVPASIISMFDVQIGDTLNFTVARNGVDYPLTIKGFYEDPFMGSSMIGMKGFLINNHDFNIIVDKSKSSGIDSLAKSGNILHILKSANSNITSSELNSLINSNSSILSATEFVHSKESLTGFMLLLQDIFSAILMAFVVILLLTTIIVLSHTINGTIEHDRVNIGILKTLGYSSSNLSNLESVIYLIPFFSASLLGMILSPIVTAFINSMTVTTTSILVPTNNNLKLVIPGLIIIIIVLVIFTYLKTKKISSIVPTDAIFKRDITNSKLSRIKIRKKHLQFWMALKQIFSYKKSYLSSVLIGVLLVLFTSMVGRIDNWLGPNGEGLMDAFNPAEVDLGVQIFSDLPRADVEATIEEFSSISDFYELAMPNISLNSVNYSANVITEPERLHILKGKAPRNEDEVVLTEFLAIDLGLGIGDKVMLSSTKGINEFTITGFYQCANDMGENIALSREGYLLIAYDDPTIWCVHYFIDEPDKKFEIMETLEEKYRVDIHVHENGWPGLYGILSAMKSLMIFMYIVAAFIILISVTISGNKIMEKENKDLLIYRVNGFSTLSLRFSFVLRFLVVSLVGAIIGIFLSQLLTDPLVNLLMRYAGISGFTSNPPLNIILIPLLIVIVLFILLSWLVSSKIKRGKVTDLVTE